MSMIKEIAPRTGLLCSQVYFGIRQAEVPGRKVIKVIQQPQGGIINQEGLCNPRVIRFIAGRIQRH